jgi:PAS domain S-box-containing protein
MTHPESADFMASAGLAQAQLLWAMFEQSEDAIIAKNLDGVIQTWNKGAEKMYGYSAADTIGHPIDMLCPPDQKNEIVEIIEKITRGEHINHYETMRQRKDGETFPISVSISPIHGSNGKIVGASSIARDISKQYELRTANALLQRQHDIEVANENLTNFTYSVAHDLRAPLRALSGYSELLRDEYADVLDENGRGYTERISATSERMAKLIDELLLLSRFARAEVHLQPIDLSAEVAQIAGELQHEEPDRGVHVAIEHPVQAYADPTLIRTVLQNLVGNAWKFTSHQDHALIEFGTMPTESGAICCYVRDNGAGFDPAYMDKLFRPFQRLHTTGEFPGNGIGLASVKQIVERHGGRAWAEGAVNKGATFYFTLQANNTH